MFLFELMDVMGFKEFPFFFFIERNSLCFWGLLDSGISKVGMSFYDHRTRIASINTERKKRIKVFSPCWKVYLFYLSLNRGKSVTRSEIL